MKLLTSPESSEKVLRYCSSRTEPLVLDEVILHRGLPRATLRTTAEAARIDIGRLLKCELSWIILGDAPAQPVVSDGISILSSVDVACDFFSHGWVLKSHSQNLLQELRRFWGRMSTLAEKPSYFVSHTNPKFSS